MNNTIHSLAAGNSSSRIWSASTRWFHWINFLCVIYMIATGTFILNGDAFGISGEDKAFLKTFHVFGGYVFVTNLTIRIIVAFIGPPNARWSALLPYGKGFGAALRRQLGELKTRHITVENGHSPLGRMMVSALLLMMLTLAVTGLVLAGTDIYFPPFGAYFASMVTEGDTALMQMLVAGSKEHVTDAGWAAMREIRSPFIETHKITFYVLIAGVALHIAANVLGEVFSATGQISAMFSGRNPNSKTEESE